MCTNVGCIGALQVAVQWNIYMYMQYGNHVYSVMYIKYVCNGHCHMVDCSDFICGTYVYTSSIHISQIFGIFAKFDGHICF